MPEDFELDAKMVAVAAAHGMPLAVAQREFRLFIAEHKARGSRFKRWDQAWLTWVLRWEKWESRRGAQNGSRIDVRDLMRGYAQEEANVRPEPNLRLLR